MTTMQATVFHGVNDIRVESVPKPSAGPGEAVLRITATTICGTDLHIVRGEYPVKPGLIIGHEPVGVIEELGAGVTGYNIGDRVLVGAITPCGQCRACLSGQHSQCGHGFGCQAMGGWRFGNTINGTLSSLGVYSGKLQIPYEAIAAGLGDHRIVTTLCPGGKERMRRLINVVQSGRFDPKMLITHRFSLADIKQGYEVFGNRSEGVLKVLITP